MKLSDEIRSRPTKKGDWDSDIIASKVAGLEMDLRDLHKKLYQIEEENTAFRQHLAEASIEIGCAGSITRRIRVLKKEHGEQTATLKRENDEMRRGLKAIAGKPGYEIDCGWTAKDIANALLTAKEK